MSAKRRERAVVTESAAKILRVVGVTAAAAVTMTACPPPAPPPAPTTTTSTSTTTTTIPDYPVGSVSVANSVSCERKFGDFLLYAAEAEITLEVTVPVSFEPGTDVSVSLDVVPGLPNWNNDILPHEGQMAFADLHVWGAIPSSARVAAADPATGSPFGTLDIPTMTGEVSTDPTTTGVAFLVNEIEVDGPGPHYTCVLAEPVGFQVAAS